MRPTIPSTHPVLYPQPPHIQFAVLLYAYNNKIMTLTLFPFIADVVIQIAALYASNNPSTHPPWHISPASSHLHFILYTLTLFPFIADVVIQIAALYASNNPSTHPPWRISSHPIRCIIIRVQERKHVVVPVYSPELLMPPHPLTPRKPFRHPIPWHFARESCSCHPIPRRLASSCCASHPHCKQQTSH